MNKMKRTCYCGALREADIGKTEVACGWVMTKRDMGGIIFIDLRDREGVLQVVFDARHLSPADFAVTEGLRNQSVIAVSGVIRLRDEETLNPKIETGTIELLAKRISLLSKAAPLPFSPEDPISVREDLRLKYRFLDLRRPSLYQTLRYRHQVQSAIESYLNADGFLQVETPMLTKSTPEGARDYLVPSRVHPGTFYALPQSPQIFKQLLMVGGVDKYYQIARCFRDEDLRADRQPEFTQVDMEMSFVDQDDVLSYLEGLLRFLFEKMKGITFPDPFPRFTYQEALDQYGSDKPDLRFGFPIVDLTKIARSCSFSVFRKVADKGGVVRAINVKGGASFTRSTIEELTAKAIRYGAGGMAWIAVKEDGSLYSILTKYFKEEELQSILRAMDGAPGDFILFCADKLSTVRRTLGNLRLDIGDLLGLRKKDDYRFVIVTDFPQFEYSEEEGRYVSTHHPFTMPYPEDLPYLTSAPERVRAQAYDVVLNGIELGSGSIRIHDQEIQTKMFEALGFSKEQIDERFGFMISAFRFGTPPHGGFAFGLDRLVMLMTGANSLRDVIAFPKNKDASCPLTDAPGAVDPEQLKTLGLDQLAAAQTGGTQAAPAPNIDVGKIASLAQLSLSHEEKVRMEQDMKTILSFANQLSEVDTEGLEATVHIMPVYNVFRPDEMTQSLDRAELLQNAKTQTDGYITVPRVVE
ncbi:MAG: aspartate--tRNA ligase [Oscillospiraceae bacterium]